jgi:predicted GNAT family acetyltransferase
MTPDEIKVEREDGQSSGRYVVRIASGPEAEMTYQRVGPGTIAIDHTYVPSQYRGGGIAAKLVQAGIEDARREGTKIVPICSYVEAQFRRHPEWADLRAR